MDLYRITLSALLSLVPSSGETDLHELSRAIVEAVVERDAEAAWLQGAVEPIPWRGPRRLEQAALALVAIAHHESGLRESVARCWRTGDDGRSVSVFQLHIGRAWGRRSRRELCSSHRVAARQAMAVLASAGARGATPRAWFDGYASGDTRRRTRAGGRQYALFERLARPLARLRRVERAATRAQRAP